MSEGGNDSHRRAAGAAETEHLWTWKSLQRSYIRRGKVTGQLALYQDITERKLCRSRLCAGEGGG